MRQSIKEKSLLDETYLVNHWLLSSWSFSNHPCQYCRARMNIYNKRLLVLGGENVLVDVDDLELRIVISVRNAFWFNSTEMPHIKLFSETSLKCRINKSNVPDHSLEQNSSAILRLGNSTSYNAVQTVAFKAKSDGPWVFLNVLWDPIELS